MNRYFDVMFMCLLGTIILFISIGIPAVCVYSVLLIILLCSFKYKKLIKFFIFVSISYVFFQNTYGIFTGIAAQYYGIISPKPLLMLLYSALFGVLSGILKTKSDKVHSFLERTSFAIFALLFTITTVYSHFIHEYFLLMFSCILLMTFISLRINWKIEAIEEAKCTNHLYLIVAVILLPVISSVIWSQDQNKRVGFVNCFSVWAKSEIPYNEEDWTIKANYSYSLFEELISNKYANSKAIYRRDEFKDLGKNFDTLIFMTPTVPLKNNEKEELYKFLKDGGNVVFIADHTDLFGHARVINDLIEILGIKVNYDAVFDAKNWYTKVNFLNIPYFDFRPMTASSISVTSPNYILAWNRNLVSEKADYTKPNFFGSLTWTAEDGVGDWPIAVISNYGKGSVVLWNDSTMFSNFAIFLPRTVELIEILLDGNKYKYLAYMQKSYFLLLLMFLVLLPFFIKKRIIGHKILMCFAVISFVTSGMYLIEKPDAKAFYSNDKKVVLDVYCERRILQEALPGKDPDSSSLSAVYSNLARKPIYPVWRGEKPDAKTINKSVWFATSSDFMKASKKQLESVNKVVIIDDPEKILQGYEKKIVQTGKTVLPELTGPIHSRYNFLGKNSNCYNFNVKSTEVVVAYNMLTDPFMGNWWNSIQVSPYRKEMMNRFSDWLVKDIPFVAYVYPNAKVNNDKFNVLLRKTGKEPLQIENVALEYITYQDEKYVYLGDSVWALSVDEKGKEYLLIGPETCDDYSVLGKNRSVIEISTEK